MIYREIFSAIASASWKRVLHNMQKHHRRWNDEEEEEEEEGVETEIKESGTKKKLNSPNHEPWINQHKGKMKTNRLKIMYVFRCANGGKQIERKDLSCNRCVQCTHNISMFCSQGR